MAASAMTGGSRPHLAPHVRLKFDKSRDRWVVLAPERMLVPDEIALDILRRCTGDRTVDQIVDALAEEFDAPRQDIAADVFSLLGDLFDRGIVGS